MFVRGPKLLKSRQSTVSSLQPASPPSARPPPQTRSESSLGHAQNQAFCLSQFYSSKWQALQAIANRPRCAASESSICLLTRLAATRRLRLCLCLRLHVPLCPSTSLSWLPWPLTTNCADIFFPSIFGPLLCSAAPALLRTRQP
jgi:hypothetical protein